MICAARTVARKTTITKVAPSMPDSRAVRYVAVVEVTAKFGQGAEEAREDVEGWLADLKDFYCKVVKFERERERPE